MATTMKVKCKNCNNSFKMYWHTFKADEDIKCPHCCNVLPQTYVDQFVKPAFAGVWELNYKIRSKHDDNYCDLFEFDFEEVFVPIDKFKS